MDCQYQYVCIPECRRKTLYGTLRPHWGEVFRKLVAFPCTDFLFFISYRETLITNDFFLFKFCTKVRKRFLFPIMRNYISPTDTWGVGVMGYSDQSANSALKFNYLSISTAFHKGLDEDGYQQIGAGFQGTYTNMMLDVSNLKFEDQLTPFGFTGSTGEIFNNSTLKNNYFDLNAGILYTGSTTDKNNFYAGVSMYHITRPKQHFTGTFFLLNPRTTFHAGAYFPVGGTSTLHLSGLYSLQAQASEAVLGAALQLPVTEGEKATSVYFGSWIRLNDAVIPYLGLEFSDFRLGATYDVNTSSLKTASQSRGGIEISLIYIKKSPGSRGLPCPKY